MSPIPMPVLSASQEAAWHGLLELSEKVPGGWTLVGGQMVHLHCAERGLSPFRSTPDVDAVVDARNVPKIFATVTGALEDAGFHLDKETDGGKHLRWVRGEAQIDVLIPQGLGPRLANVKSASGKPGLETPGAQYALNRSERVEVQVGGRIGLVMRPALVGAIIVKAAAWSVPLDPDKARHLDDIGLLASMLAARDLRDAALNKGEMKYLRPAIAAATEHERLASVAGAADGLVRVGRILDASPVKAGAKRTVGGQG